MRAFVLGSGSSGNAVLVEGSGTRVLVDAGIGPRAVLARLVEFGLARAEDHCLGQSARRDPALRPNRPRPFDAIVATHEHGDHFGHAASLARAFDVPVYLHHGIAGERVRRKVEVRTYDAKKPFRIGGLMVEAEAIPHDAPQVAIRVSDVDGAFGIATDVGRVTGNLVGLLATCDAALVEANHCPEMLAFGPYPTRLQERVRGGLGHLSNEETADLARRLVGSRLGRLWLGHLSRTNNTPERALATVAPCARGITVSAVAHGESELLTFRRTRPAQLGLPFA